MSRHPLILLLFASASCLSLLATGRAARADLVTSYNVFAAHEVRLSGTINSAANSPGAIGSNLDVRLLGSGKFTSLAGGGTLYGTGIAPNISGNVTFAQNVNLAALSTVGGNVSAGGSANLQGTVSGNVTAGGGVTSSALIDGNLLAGGDASTSGLGIVDANLLSNGNVHVGANVVGNVNYGLGKSFSLAPGKTVGGLIASSTLAISPAAFDPVIMPAAHSITTGATSINVAVFSSRTIASGHYDHLTLGGSNTINLSSGDYYFTDFAMTGPFVTINYNLSSGPINIYVKGNANFNNADSHVNGASYAASNPGLAPQINFEVQGAMTVQTSNMFGTFYAPFGDITIGTLSNFTGGVYSGHDIIANGTNFSFGSGNNPCVPEPSTYALLGSALAAGLPLLRARLRRSRAS